MPEFPFSDLHSFKDFVAFVRLCAPDRFPAREGVAKEYQWSLDLAFAGLREGLTYLPQNHKAFAECCRFFDEAYGLYKQNDYRSGALKIGEAQKILRRIPTR